MRLPPAGQVQNGDRRRRRRAKLTTIQVVNGDQVKQHRRREGEPGRRAEKDELRQAALMQESTQLTPLLGRARSTPSRPRRTPTWTARRRRCARQRRRASRTRLFFDKKTGRLVKTQRKGLAPTQGEPIEVNEETFLSDFKPVGGVMLPMKVVVTHDGKKFMTVTVTEAKPVEKVDQVRRTIFEIEPESP